MAISTFDVTDDVQLSVRGSTVQNPDSYYVLGIFMGERCIKADNTYQSQNIDWAKAVDMAKWILEEDDWIRNTYLRSIYPDDIQRYLIGNNWIKVCETSSKAVYESAYGVQISVPTKRDCTDYLRIVEEAVSILSTVEDRSFYDVISDIKKMGNTENGKTHSERKEDTIGMLDRRGRCERCGCAITGTGLCKKCNDIVDKEVKE